MNNIIITGVTPENVLEQSLYCIKDRKNPGFDAKRKWLCNNYRYGLRMKIARDDNGSPLAFIEYLPANLAWRPVDAPGFMFIHCLFSIKKKDKMRGGGSHLLKYCCDDAKDNGMSGVAVMTSKGSWMADNRIYEKAGFVETDSKERYELMALVFDPAARKPRLIDWTANRNQYTGWHLIFANQCPFFANTVRAIQEAADVFGIKLNINEIKSAKDAKNSPAGYGVFCLIHDGKILAEHYISRTRFVNILKKELHV